MSVFKDTRTLATQVVRWLTLSCRAARRQSMIPHLMTTEQESSPPTYVEPVVVTIDNYKEMLIESGYYTEDQVKVRQKTIEGQLFL